MAHRIRLMSAVNNGDQPQLVILPLIPLRVRSVVAAVTHNNNSMQFVNAHKL